MSTDQRRKKHTTRISQNQKSPTLLPLLQTPAQTRSRHLTTPTLCKVPHLNRTGGNIANALNRNSNKIGRNGIEQTTPDNKGQSTTACRHGRCESCNKPTSTSNLDTTYPLLCLDCVPKRVTPEPKNPVQDRKQSYKQGLEKTGRDDEEEWSGIPIPQSDDSDDEHWLDESDESELEQHEADTGPFSLNLRKPDDDPDDASTNLTSQNRQTPTSPAMKEQKQMSMENINDYAFLIGPRRDGRIKRKDGTVLSLQELPHTLNQSHQTVHTSLEPIILDSPFPMSPTALPSWTGHLMRFQKSTLKMGYNAYPSTYCSVLSVQ